MPRYSPRPPSVPRVWGSKGVWEGRGGVLGEGRGRAGAGAGRRPNRPAPPPAPPPPSHHAFRTASKAPLYWGPPSVWVCIFVLMVSGGKRGDRGCMAGWMAGGDGRSRGKQRRWRATSPCAAAPNSRPPASARQMGVQRPAGTSRQLCRPQNPAGQGRMGGHGRGAAAWELRRGAAARGGRGRAVGGGMWGEGVGRARGGHAPPPHSWARPLLGDRAQAPNRCELGRPAPVPEACQAALCHRPTGRRRSHAGPGNQWDADTQANAGPEKQKRAQPP